MEQPQFQKYDTRILIVNLFITFVFLEATLCGILK